MTTTHNPEREGRAPMGGHTPGPWHVSIWGGEFSRGVIETIAEPVTEICHIAKFEVATAGPTVQANARLIAAAPDLLAERDRLERTNAALVEALEAVLPLAVSYAADQHHALDHPRNTPYLNTLDEAIDAARAALASAAERKAGRG